MEDLQWWSRTHYGCPRIYRRISIIETQGFITFPEDLVAKAVERVEDGAELKELALGASGGINMSGIQFRQPTSPGKESSGTG